MPEKSLYKIFIDAADRNNSEVILFKIENNVEKEIARKSGQIDLVGSIQKLLVENSLDIKDIGEFKSNLGPGSFTGLKMGVTVANTLNWALGKKTIPELDYPEYGREPNISQPKSTK